jgi:hypothetical protein
MDRKILTTIQIRIPHLNRRPQFRLLNFPEPPIGVEKVLAGHTTQPA